MGGGVIRENEGGDAVELPPLVGKPNPDKRRTLFADELYYWLVTAMFAKARLGRNFNSRQLIPTGGSSESGSGIA